jgi:flotillin
VATKEKEIRVAENMAEAEKGKKRADAERRIFVSEQESQAVAGENTAQATIAARNAELAVKQAEAQQEAEVAQNSAVVEIQKARYMAEKERLKAEELAVQEIAKQRIEIEAAAHAEQQRLIAKGEADATLMKYAAEAEGLKKLLESKAEGYKLLVSSAGGDAKSAATLLLLEKLEEIVKMQTEAIKNIKIDKVTVWDSGNDKNGSATSNFMSNLVKSLPPLHDVAAMAGLDLPEFLGSTQQNIAKEEN